MPKPDKGAAQAMLTQSLLGAATMDFNQPAVWKKPAQYQRQLANNYSMSDIRNSGIKPN